MKKFYIRTFGCQMNNYDSQVVSDLLTSKGYTKTEEINSADIILFNTCSVRQHAEDRALGNVALVKKIKQKKPNIIVGVLGCVAQNLGEEITKKMPFVDLVLGTKDMFKVVSLIKEVETSRKQMVFTSLEKTIENIRSTSASNVAAYVTVVRGCSNFCSYCIVPYVRGKEQSREPKEIVEEIKGLVKEGVKEVILLGQNVNYYGQDLKTNLETLLKQIHDIQELQKIDFVTSHPKSVTITFVKAISKLPKVSKQIHMPFQSGSNKILKSMNRLYTREEYIDKVNSFRKIIPDIRITTDIIVGYPGETQRDFKDTLDLIKECQLDLYFTFKYSPRKGTKAYQKMEDNIPKKEKEQRLAILNKLCNSIRRQKK